MKGKNFLALILVFILLVGFYPAKAAEIKPQKVFIVPLNGVVNQGMESFLKRSIREAEEEKIQMLIFQIDTPGGEVNSAVKMSQEILDTPIPTISFIKNEAISAGVILAISSDKLIMTSIASIGAAETRPKEEKYISYWSSKLRAAAEKTGRDEQLVAAMADEDIEIPGVKKKGKILTLTAKEAKKLALADNLAESLDELLAMEELTNAAIIMKQPNPAEKLAQITTNPFIAPIILTIGIVGILIEFFTPGFGLPGFIGLITFSLFFGANILAGAAQYWILGLFLLGILLLVIEMFIPGFGIFGIMGIISIFSSIVLAFPSVELAIKSVIAASIASFVILFIVFKYIIKTPVFGKIILATKQDKSHGYVASKIKKDNYIGKTGIALTSLRPVGVGIFGKEKLDVITEGDFISKGEKIEIVKVEGTKIIVIQKKEGEHPWNL